MGHCASFSKNISWARPLLSPSNFLFRKVAVQIRIKSGKIWKYCFELPSPNKPQRQDDIEKIIFAHLLQWPGKPSLHFSHVHVLALSIQWSLQGLVRRVWGIGEYHLPFFLRGSGVYGDVSELTIFFTILSPSCTESLPAPPASLSQPTKVIADVVWSQQRLSLIRHWMSMAMVSNTPFVLVRSCTSAIGSICFVQSLMLPSFARPHLHHLCAPHTWHHLCILILKYAYV